MAGPKSKPETKTAVRRARPKAAKKAAMEKRTARDVPAGPPAKRIEFSFEKGTRETLESFRNKIGW
jgi:hypothetical protein